MKIWFDIAIILIITMGVVVAMYVLWKSPVIQRGSVSPPPNNFSSSRIPRMPRVKPVRPPSDEDPNREYKERVDGIHKRLFGDDNQI